MEIEEIPSNKSTEPTNPEPKDRGEKKIQIIKEKKKVKMEERKTLRPRKARVTKELIEMTRNGLINVVNLPIINHEERVFRKEYRRKMCIRDRCKRLIKIRNTRNN